LVLAQVIIREVGEHSKEGAYTQDLEHYGFEGVAKS
jgi:hypothetical protein